MIDIEYNEIYMTTKSIASLPVSPYKVGRTLPIAPGSCCGSNKRTIIIEYKKIYLTIKVGICIYLCLDISKPVSSDFPNVRFWNALLFRDGEGSNAASK